MAKKIVNVTKPYLPPLDEFLPFMEEIWDSKVLTNNGLFNVKFCKELERLWEVEHVVTFSNGTQALIAALSCLNHEDKGEVITTPFTFIATTNAIIWTGNCPVFVDIDPSTLNIDPQAIENAITDKTVAILAVHCYGRPCDIAALSDISQRYNIPVIYDAAHAFGVEYEGKSLISNGEMSVLSFHATKIFNTFEGGAVACKSAVTKNKLMNFANFGFQNETTISSLGLNAKMSEFNAALGLLQLKHIDKMLEGREVVAQYYFNTLNKLESIFIPQYLENTRPNYSYFPIFIEPNVKADRDEIYHYLREYGFMVRRYFYPLTCDFGVPEVERKAIKFEVKFAEERAEQVLCLPIYPGLEIDQVVEIVELLKRKLV